MAKKLTLPFLFVFFTACGAVQGESQVPSSSAPSATTPNPEATQPAGTTTSTGTTPTPPSPVTVSSTDITVYVNPNNANQVSSASQVGYVPVNITWIAGASSQSNCNIACSSTAPTQGAIELNGEWVVGFIGVSGLYTTTESCLQVNPGAAASLCSTDFAKCVGGGCSANPNTGVAFAHSTDPSQLAIAKASNDYLGVPGCYVQCWSNIVSDGNTLVAPQGMMRVSGDYQGTVCQPTGFVGVDISTVTAFKTECTKDFPTACANNACWGGGDTYTYVR